MIERLGMFDVTVRGSLGRLKRRLRGERTWRLVSAQRLTRRGLRNLAAAIAAAHNSPEGLRNLAAAIAAEHTSPEGVLSIKLMWPHHENLLRKGMDVSVWGAPVTWVSIRRSDHVRQAVSWCRAEQTGKWGGAAIETGVPIYDEEHIERLVKRAVDHERNWSEYFARHGIRPFEIVYEDFDGNYEATMEQLFRYLGCDGAMVVDRPTERQSDHVNDEWVARFLATRHEVDR